MQNETLKIIRSRRSIRNYKSDPLKDEEIQAIVQAAVYAPSAVNRQDWHFSLVQNPGMLAKMRRIMDENTGWSGEGNRDPSDVPFFNAPAVIIISADQTTRSAQINCGIAAENIALAAESLNIGSCIMTSSRALFQANSSFELSRELGIPEGYTHVCTVTLGYKAEFPQAAPRREGTVTLLK